jgi:GNAT superfamily N-acetyltransferase
MSGPSDDFVIALASAEELACLPEIEARAAGLFAPESLPPDLPLATSVEKLRPAQAEGRIWVARARDGRVLGFALVESLGSDGVLEELDVEPEAGRRGIGTRLVEAACDWALAKGHARIVLSTFREIPWNAPFYARLGFREIPESERTQVLSEMRDAERALGFALEDRVLMARILRSD